MARRLAVRASTIALLLVIVATAWEWPPAAEGLVPDDEARRKIESVAASLAGNIQPAAFAAQLDTMTRYPPAASATEDLARAVAACDVFASLDSATRERVAYRLWEVMNGGQLTAPELARTLLDMQHAAAKAGCAPNRIDVLTQAGHAAARHAADQRRDWW